ncbi:MAG: ABC transporter substrate-binding protein [Rhodobacteraceae bacterium]|nr:ABC transporter substrate-binding protein [Paracoccaceae bacterium]
MKKLHSRWGFCVATSVLALSASLAWAEEDPIIIGAVVAESGFMSQYDIPAWTAAKFAIDDINNGTLAVLGSSEPGLLGRKVEFVVRDYRTDRDVAPTVAQEVIEAGADILIASCDFDFGSPAALIAQDDNIVSMSLCAGSPRFGPEGGLDLGFSAGSVAEATSAAAAEWAYDKMGWKTAYVLNDPVIQVDTDWANGFVERFGELAGAEAILGEDGFKNDDANINAQISRIKDLPAQPDVLIVTSFPPGGASAVRQLRSAGLTQPILLNDAMDGSSWWDTVPESGRAGVFVTVRGHYQGADTDERINALSARYKASVGEYPPSSLFVDGYGAIEMLAVAIQAAGTTDGAAVTAELEKLRGFDRIAGPATFTAELHDAPDRAIAILELTADGAKLVDRVKARRVPKYSDIVDEN